MIKRQCFKTFSSTESADRDKSLCACWLRAITRASRRGCGPSRLQAVAMYIWQWRTCAFKHHFPKCIAFLSPSWVHRPYREKNEEKNKRTTSKRRMAAILSIESKTNAAFGGQLTQRTDTKGKKKKTTQQRKYNCRQCESETWHSIMYNIMSTILHHLQHKCQHRPSLLKVGKRHRGIKRWAHKMMPLSSTSQAASSSSWYHSLGTIISSKAHQKSI